MHGFLEQIFSLLSQICALHQSIMNLLNVNVIPKTIRSNQDGIATYLVIGKLIVFPIINVWRPSPLSLIWVTAIHFTPINLERHVKLTLLLFSHNQLSVSFKYSINRISDVKTPQNSCLRLQGKNGQGRGSLFLSQLYRL